MKTIRTYLCYPFWITAFVCTFIAEVIDPVKIDPRYWD